MKEELKVLLNELGHKVQDFGAYSEEAVDYPDFAHAVARAVADGSSDVGIVIDGAGVGSAITANKVPGVRAAACYSVEVARNSRAEARRSTASRCATSLLPGLRARSAKSAIASASQKSTQSSASISAKDPLKHRTAGSHNNSENRTSQEGWLAPLS